MPLAMKKTLWEVTTLRPNAAQPHRANAASWQPTNPCICVMQNGGQSSRQQGSGNVEQTAKQWLTGGQKWLKSAGKKLATVAKESASEIQKRLETVDVKMQKGNACQAATGTALGLLN